MCKSYHDASVLTNDSAVGESFGEWRAGLLAMTAEYIGHKLRFSLRCQGAFGFFRLMR